MQLRRLTQLEGKKLRDELEELQATIKELESILDEPRPSSRGVIKDELAEVRDKYADERRTELTVDAGEIDVLDLIEDEEVVVVLIEQGLHQDRRGRRVPPAGPRRPGVRGGNLRDDDYVDHLLTTTAHSYLLFFSNRGRCTGCVRTRSR